MEQNPATPATATKHSAVLSLVAVAWVVGVAVVWLAGFGAGLIPVQLLQIASAALPTLRVGPNITQFFAHSVGALIWLVAVLATAYAVGAVLLVRLVTRRDLLGILYVLTAGLWVMAVVVLVLGAFSISLVPFVFAGLGLWLLPAPRQLARGQRTPLEGWEKLMVACIIIAALANLPGTLAPPFEYDELEYHLGAPADYIRAGHIIFLPHNFYSNLPQLTEMHYLLALVTAGDVAAKLLHWGFGLLTAVALGALATRLWSRRVGMTAAALFYCLPFVQDLSQTARVDLATTFFATLAYGGLLLWQKEREGQWFWLSSLAAGAAVATKWTAIPVVLLPALVFVAIQSRSPKQLALFVFLSSLFVLPWLVKNFLLTGNPVYPLLTNILPNPHWSPEQAALFARRHYATFDWAGWRQFWELPRRYSLTEPGAAPLLLMTVPLLLLARPSDATARRAGALLLAGFAGWFLLTFRPWRFLFPVFPVAALVGAWAMHRVARTRIAGWLINRAISLVLIVALTTTVLGNLVDVEEDPVRLPPRMSFLQYAFGQASRTEFIARVGRGTFAPIVWMNEHLPATANVLYVGEARAYYARHRVLWSTAFDQHPLEIAGGAQLPVTHVYVNYSEWKRMQQSYGRFGDERWQGFVRGVEHTYRPVFQGGPGVVFEQ